MSVPRNGRISKQANAPPLVLTTGDLNRLAPNLLLALGLTRALEPEPVLLLVLCPLGRADPLLLVAVKGGALAVALPNAPEKRAS
jgi:hypothetical protein